MTFKTRFTLDGRLQRRELQKIMGSTSPYVVNFSSPSVVPEVLRTFFWFSVQYPQEMCTTKQADYKQAYLNSKRKAKDAKIFVRLPPGVLIDGQKQGVANIHFYGELDAGLRWFENLTISLTKISEFIKAPLTQNEHDPTFFHFFSSTVILLILANVDDLLLTVIGTNHAQFMDELLTHMKNDYELTITETIDHFIGLNLTWATDHSWIKITMEDKIAELSELLNLADMAPVKGCIPKDFNNAPLPKGYVCYHEPFPTIYGKFLFISHYRPDVAIAKTKLAPFMHLWGKHHWDALIHTCTYLYQTNTFGMFLSRSAKWKPGHTNVEIISDAGELANTNSLSKSIIGHVCFVEHNLISFRSKNTSSVTCDAAHAELMGLYAATKVINNIDNIFLPMHPIMLEKPIPLFGDNLASLWIARTKGNSTRTKHYNVKLHYIYEQITRDLLETKHVDSLHCIADFLTKIQELKLFLQHRNYYVADDIDDLQFFYPPTQDKSDI